MNQMLEIGAGNSPMPGYTHNDLNPFPDIEIVCKASEINLPDNSCSVIIALGAIEHFTWEEAGKAFANFHRMLKPGGIFVCDAPDIFIWSQYLYDTLRGNPCPLTPIHVNAGFWGWQRWPGDEHKCGWTHESLRAYLIAAGFSDKKIVEDPNAIRPLPPPHDPHFKFVATK